MTSIEQTGRTVEDAIKAALKILGVTREDVDVEVLSQESRGLLGILGYSEAKVRVTVKAGLEPEPTPESGVSAYPEAAEAAEEEVSEEAPEERPRAPREEPVEIPPEQRTEMAKRALAVLDEILSLMEVTARGEITREDTEAVYLTLQDEEDLGLLIGKRGQTLASLQLVVAMIANRPLPAEERKRVVLDAADYRARRERALIGMARAAAERAQRTGREVPLEALSARERRVVHVTLADNPAVTTRSEGDEPNRYVVIVPARGSRERPRARPRRY